ncbi:MAG: hypothetical protein R3F65_22810 [bacterium]
MSDELSRCSLYKRWRNAIQIAALMGDVMTDGIDQPGLTGRQFDDSIDGLDTGTLIACLGVLLEEDVTSPWVKSGSRSEPDVMLKGTA